MRVSSASPTGILAWSPHRPGRLRLRRVRRTVRTSKLTRRHAAVALGVLLGRECPPMSQPNVTSTPDVDGDGSFNRTVAPPNESNEPAGLPQGLARFDVTPNSWHAAVSMALMLCSPNRNTFQLLSLPNDLLLNIATHLHLESRSLVAFLTCCNALWAPGRRLLFKAHVEHQQNACRAPTKTGSK